MKYILIILLSLFILPSYGKALFSTYYVGTPGVYLDLQNLKANLSLVDGDVVIIKSGTYPGGIISNSSFGATKITLRASDTGIVFTGKFDVTNCKNIIFSKLRWEGVSDRGLALNFPVDSCTFQDFRMHNISDYGVIFQATGGSYDGTSATRYDNISFLRDTIKALGSGFGADCMILNGGQSVNYYLTIRNCVFDSTYGTDLYTLNLKENCKYADIQYNTFQNIALGGTAHNACIYFRGSGTIANNLSLNRQGNFGRLRAYSVDSSTGSPVRDTLFVYNNRDCGARKYAQFELQHIFTDTTTNTNLPNTRTGVFFIINNTCLNTRDGGYFPWNNSTGGGGGQFDVYGWIIPPIIKNNICARAYIDSVPNPLSPPGIYTFNYQFHDGGGTKPVGQPIFGDTSNNIYSHVASQISANWYGNDTLAMQIAYNSRARGTGTNAYLYKIPTDWQGQTRYPQSDIGASQLRVGQLGPVRWKAIKKAN